MPDYQHWSRYWARGCLTSLPQDFSRNYDGEVAAFWEGIFAAQGDGSSLLDVCTGNGALALLAASHARRHDKTFSITGIDAARVDPAAVRQAHPDAAEHMGDIRFIDGVPFEQSDLPTASFDLVMSQYGLEYCPWEAAAAKVEDVLRPGGQLVCIAHAPGSDLFDTMQRESRDFAALDELRVPAVFEAFSAGRLGAAELRSELNRIGPALFQRHRQRESDLFRYVLGLADRLLGFDDARLAQQREAVDEILAEMLAARARSADMLAANEAISRHPDWTRAFEEAGLDRVESGGLQYGGDHHVGTFHRFVKPRQ